MTTETLSETTTDELEELDMTSAELLCEALRTQIQAFAATSKDVDTQFRTILRKIRHADTWDAESLVLTPKVDAARWLKRHGWMEPTIEMAQFLRLFFQSAKALDIESQSLHLEKEEADLFHVGTEVSIYALLRNLPLVFA